MKLHNSNIREILEQSGQISCPLDHEEISAQYELFISKNIKRSAPVESSVWHFSYKQLISKNIMITSKKVLVGALVLAISAGALTIGYNRALAYNLASTIQNAPNASEYFIDLDFSDVLLNGKVVEKNSLAKILEKNNDSVSMIGGVTGYTGNSPLHEDTTGSYVANGETIIPAQPVDSDSVATVIVTTEDFAKNLGVSVEEAKRIEEEAVKYPYGIGFEQATKFLELKKEKTLTYIGVDKNGEIVFFTTIAR